MLGAVAASTALCFSPSTPPTRIFVHRGVSNSTLPLSNHGHSFSLLSSTPMHFSSLSSRRQPLFLTQAASSSGQILWSLLLKLFSALFLLFQFSSPLSFLMPICIVCHVVLPGSFLILLLLGMHLALSWKMNNADQGINFKGCGDIPYPESQIDVSIEYVFFFFFKFQLNVNFESCRVTCLIENNAFAYSIGG